MNDLLRKLTVLELKFTDADKVLYLAQLKATYPNFINALIKRATAAQNAPK
jgi:hypothetical protein